MIQFIHPDFIILSAPRSGSTWLQFLLNEHPDLYCAGELLSIHSPNCCLGRLMPTKFNRLHHTVNKLHRNSDLPWKRFTRVFNRTFGHTQNFVCSNKIHHLFEQGLMPTSQKVDMNGFKLMRLHLKRFGIPLAQYLQGHCKNQVTLIRKNILKRWVSLMVAKMKVNFSSFPNAKTGNKWKIPLNKMLIDLDEFRSAEKDLVQYNLGQKKIVITYEDLLQKPDQTWFSLCDFFEIPRIQIPLSKTIKQNSDLLCEVVANYDQMKSMILGTKYEVFLD
jgi:hypothetical protein